MGNEDVSLTFDPNSFLQGLKKITDAMNGFEKTTKTKGEQVNKSTGNMSSFMVAKGMLMANMIMAAFHKAFNFIKTGLPELSRVSSIAGGIFQRNFLWPLRKEIAPYLQKILDWTRDHRAMFVRWGGILVNVFRSVMAVGKGAIGLLKAMFEPIGKMLKRVFGGVAKDITEVFNILLFKMTAIFLFISVVFKPLFETFGKIIARMVQLMASFWEGFKNGISGIAEPLTDVINMLVQLADALGLTSDEAGLMTSAFKILGDFLGTTLYSVIMLIAEGLDFIVNTIRGATAAIKMMYAEWNGDAVEAKRINDEFEKQQEAFEKRSAERWEKAKAKWGGFVDRTKAEFSANPETSSKQINNSTNVKVDNMNIVIDKNTNPEKAGKEFMEGVKKGSGVQKQLKDERVSTGGYK